MTGVTKRVVGERRLSPLRAMLLCLILAGIAACGIFGADGLAGKLWFARAAVPNQWFAPYVDVTATPMFAFQNLGANARKDAVLAFIVSDPVHPCEPSWGGAYTLNQAGDSLDLDRRIARLRQQGGHIAVSFGGVKNNELAVGCTAADRLLAAYQAVVDRYKLNTIDLDLESAGLADVAAGSRRAEAIARLQSERRAAGKQLAVWVTLPVSPQGLREEGTNAVAQLLKHGVDLAGVNAMTMDYGASRSSDQTMLGASESALIQTERQLKILYQQAGVNLSDSTLWSKLGATPMIGQNDYKNEIFTLDDAQALNRFALSRGIGRLSIWSANRDMMCGSNYVDVSTVSDACSGVEQTPYAFSDLLGSGYEGNMVANAGAVTASDQASASQQLPDDPATSPYQIWSPTTVYLVGTKVVRHHNVYEAKWWTKGDIPDNPVLQSWQTPWNLIGPVLPGEKPSPQPALPKDAYPAWSDKAVYEAGQRVVFEGVPYQAKWWSQGESPSFASVDPDSAAWKPLTQAQINAILSNLEKKG
ncbi:chitinase [Cohnella rhizosphaerae]|uniref:Glycosyl hydrolase family 18 protein n=1 Tax=Cohnella rhizosphaerae TaxID=1457232 RepID=A0A9X4KR32_9BACL|nr:carbohydrate-binding protein [Cohnella rhizosphaerae]MDG0809222.1 glycosyl hydrolase family 18 protein [Cohnella rhizosphaerae]